MGKVTITKSMSEHEAKRLLRSISEPKATVEEGLDDLLESLKEYEQKFGMSTLEFYRKFIAGKMGDDMDVIAWAGLYEIFVMMSQELTGAKGAAR
jgi:hypothetical protein